MGKPYSEDLRGAAVRSIEASDTREETLPPMLNCAVMVAATYQCAAEALGRSPTMLSMAV
jgi:hypothetical protein